MTRHAAVALAILFWAWVFIQRKIVGPLNSDEVYFAHTLWLVNTGARQYVDFYSHHLPTYFAFWKLLSPLYDTTGLTVVWVVRLSGLLLAVAYLAIAWLALRDVRRFIPAVALLLLYFTLGRMIEIRTDTFGLLLFNAAWALLLIRRDRWAMIGSAALAVMALAFSARAGIVAVGFAGTLLWLVWRRRDWWTLAGLCALGACVLAALGMIYVASPEWSMRVIRSAYLNPVSVMSEVSYWRRFVALDRSVLVAIILVGGYAGWRIGGERGGMLLGAAVTQLALILLDPSPFEYVYSWVALPMVIGMVSIAPALAGIGAFLAAALWLSLSIAYVGAKGHQPPTLSSYRLTLDPPIGPLDRLSTQAMVELMIDHRGQENLWNQLVVMSAVCRRVHGPVLTVFASNPICLHDADFYWLELHWPGWAQATNRTAVMTPAEFAAVFRDRRPALFIWRSYFGATVPLEPVLRRELASGYEVHDGFALRR